MARFIPEKLVLEAMASGHLCLRLSEKIGWEDFPHFAEELISLIDGEVVSRADGVEMRLWELRLPRCTLRLVYEDFPACTSLESTTDDADRVLRELHRKLRTNYDNLK